MIVSDADVALTEAKTSLIKAQAAVHTTKLTLVASTAGDAETKADVRRGDRAGAARRERLPPRARWSSSSP